LRQFFTAVPTLESVTGEYLKTFYVGLSNIFPYVLVMRKDKHIRLWHFKATSTMEDATRIQFDAPGIIITQHKLNGSLHIYDSQIFIISV
jgi:hypothetical protein